MPSHPRIHLASPHMSEEGYELAYVREAFDANWIAPLGANVDAFERETADRVGVKAAAALSSGTAALHLALRAVGAGPGDVVLCQSLTFAGSAYPIVYQGATPVFVDSDRATWNLDPNALETALKAHAPRVKAVVAVHLYGLAADVDPILALCRAHGVPLLEDAAESLGTTYKGHPTGSFGDFGILSFNGNKIITTSGGGMLLSDDDERIAKARFWATQARDPAPHYEHSEIGYNYRMSNVVAGIGRGQLRVLDRRIARKQEILAFYRRALSGLDGVAFMPENPWCEPNAWLSCLTLAGRVRPAQVIAALAAENVEARPLWKPMHLQPVFRGCAFHGSGVSERLFEDGLCLPSDTKMTDDDLDRVARIVRSVWP